MRTNNNIFIYLLPITPIDQFYLPYTNPNQINQSSFSLPSSLLKLIPLVFY